MYKTQKLFVKYHFVLNKQSKSLKKTFFLAAINDYWYNQNDNFYISQQSTKAYNMKSKKSA